MISALEFSKEQLETFQSSLDAVIGSKDDEQGFKFHLEMWDCGCLKAFAHTGA